MKLIKQNYLLLIILLFGLLLRVYQLTSKPMYGDELTIVYDSFSILKTGQDQLGNFLPVTFRMGAGRPGGYVYFSLPFVFAFGPTALGVRGLSLVSGLGVILLVYLLAKDLFSKKIALLAAFITATSPWDLSLSRGGFEAHFALFLMLLGTYLFIRAKQKPQAYLFSALSWGLAIHTYPTYKFTLPIFLLVLVWYTGGVKKLITSKSKKILSISLIMLALFFGLAAKETFTGQSEERFLSINIFARQDIRGQIEHNINYDRLVTTLPESVVFLFHNKAIEYSKLYLSSYLKNFSYDFLFLNGDGNPRHNVSEMGELYWIEVLLVFTGFLVLFKRDLKRFYFILFWILVVPIATALLVSPHALRDAFMFVPLVFLSAYGFNFLLEQKYLFKGLTLLVVGLFFFAQFVFVLNNIYFLSPNKHARLWAYPAKKAIEEAVLKKNDFDYVILSTKIENIEYAYAVYEKINPSKVIEQNKNPTQLNGVSFKNYSNVFIGDISKKEFSNFVESLDGSVLFIGDYLNQKDYFDNYKIIYMKDYSPALIVGEFNVHS
jgi:4-amino-4-deoxy-L-arabinose transferase-like glycosyltransferase